MFILMKTLHVIETGLTLHLEDKIFHSNKSSVYKTVINDVTVIVKITSVTKKIIDVIDRVNTIADCTPHVYFIICPVTSALNRCNSFHIYHSNALADKQIVYVMEYIEGLKWTSMKPREIISCYQQLAINLQKLHNLNIYHRDIKPPNLIFRPDHTVNYIDFDLAVLQITGITNIRAYTPNYAAPEAFGKREWSVDDLVKIDVYSLGMTFLVLAGKQTVSDYTKDETIDTIEVSITTRIDEIVANMCDELPYEFDQYVPLIMRMCSHNPQMRPSLLEIQEELQQIQFREIDGVDTVADTIVNYILSSAIECLQLLDLT